MDKENNLPEVKFTPDVASCRGQLDKVSGISPAIPADESIFAMRRKKLPNLSPRQRVRILDSSPSVVASSEFHPEENQRVSDLCRQSPQKIQIAQDAGDNSSEASDFSHAAAFVTPSAVTELVPARNGKPYETEIKFDGVWSVLPGEGWDILAAHGLIFYPQVSGRSTSVRLSGKPDIAGLLVPKVFSFSFRMSSSEGKIRTENISLLINPNPKDLWRNLPPADPKFAKPTEAVACIEKGGDAGNFAMLAASRRGRSHAHEALHREDDFAILRIEDAGWHVVGVADGAGSCKYSREGSRLACKAASDYFRQKLSSSAFGSFVQELDSLIPEAYQEALKGNRLGRLDAVAGELMGGAVKSAQEAIANSSASESGSTVKDFSTTLILAAVKKFSFGAAILSFWVGDGAIAAIRIENGNLVPHLLGTPDEGEFGGQTKFITMPDVCDVQEQINQRTTMCFCPDAKPLAGLVLMSDGVSDPYFETTSGLCGGEKWRALLAELAPIIQEEAEGAERLLQWLDFESPGNHDDRTIAILH